MDFKVHKYKKEFIDKREIAYKYFAMLSIFNDFKLTEREIDLLSHIAITGTINSVSSKKEFIRIYETTMQTMNNTIGFLYKKKLLIKENRKIKINPILEIDFINNDKFLFTYTCLFQNELKN